MLNFVVVIPTMENEESWRYEFFDELNKKDVYELSLNKEALEAKCPDYKNISTLTQFIMQQKYMDEFLKASPKDETNGLFMPHHLTIDEMSVSMKTGSILLKLDSLDDKKESIDLNKPEEDRMYMIKGSDLEKIKNHSDFIISRSDDYDPTSSTPVLVELAFCQYLETARSTVIDLLDSWLTKQVENAGIDDENFEDRYDFIDDITSVFINKGLMNKLLDRYIKDVMHYAHDDSELLRLVDIIINENDPDFKNEVSREMIRRLASDMDFDEDDDYDDDDYDEDDDEMEDDE